MEEVKVTGTTIENLGILDLIDKKPEDLAAVTQIQNVGVVLAPEALSGALMKIPQKNVGLIVTIPPTSGKIKRLTGQLTVDGEAFANHSGSPEDMLVIAGQIIITSEIEVVGFKEVIVAGQIIAPKKAERALVGAVSQLTGQIVYYTGETPRLFVGNDTFSKAFLDLIDGNMSMILIGSFEFGSDVDTSTLKQKITELVLIGELRAPKELIPLLQLLAVVKLGNIVGKENVEAQSEQ
ncbi:hypothetical protein [Paenibacillus harenae]|uniref:hypothetical protein n=1 Tax=Paenibacillus harenae TaxID=306543 RepID=UPI00040A0E72|nr:hypothetical protein [Paenibacillus harenae]